MRPLKDYLPRIYTTTPPTHVYPFPRCLFKYIGLLIKLCSTDEIYKFLSHLPSLDHPMSTTAIEKTVGCTLSVTSVKEMVVEYLTKSIHLKGELAEEAIIEALSITNIILKAFSKVVDIVGKVLDMCTMSMWLFNIIKSIIKWIMNNPMDNIHLHVLLQVIKNCNNDMQANLPNFIHNITINVPNLKIVLNECMGKSIQANSEISNHSMLLDTHQPSCHVHDGSWSSVPLPCSATHTTSLCAVIPSVCVSNVTVEVSLVRGHKKLSRQRSRSTEVECASEEASPSSRNQELVRSATLCAAKMYKTEKADIVTGREGSSTNPLNPSTSVSQRGPLPRVTNHPSTCTPQSTHTEYPTQISTKPMPPPPLSTFPSTTSNINLCKDSEAIFSSAAECLSSEQYNHIIQLLGQINHHSCTTQHCHAVLSKEFGMGLGYYKLANYHLAMEHFTEYLRLARTHHRAADESLAHVYIGDISALRSDYSSAADQYFEAIKTHGANNACSSFKLATPSVSSLYTKQGTVLKQASQMVNAVKAFRKAIQTALDGKSKLSAHNSLGNVLQSMGDYSGALEQYEESTNLAEDVGDLVSLGWSHGNMGNAYLGLHQKDKALYHLKKSLELTVANESTPQAISRAYNNLGTAYQSMEDLKLAEVNFKLALDQAIYGGDAAGQARAQGNLGNLLMLNKRHKEAIDHYSEVFHLSKDRQVLSTAYHNRGCVYYEWAEQVRLKPMHSSEVKANDVYSNDAHSSGVTTKYKASSNEAVVCRTSSNEAGVYRTSSSEAGVYRTSSSEAGVHRTSSSEPQDLASKPTSNDLYMLGVSDLTKAVGLCNEVFQSTKGSIEGLALSVSIIENSSRTFHKLQDCLVSLGQTDDALVVAEQCRARTLGEILLGKRGGVAGDHMAPPLTLGQIKHIVGSQDCPVVYLSYTGTRIMIWLMTPLYGYVSSIHCRVVEVDKLEKGKLDGKTFDQYVRQSLQETVVGSDLELFHDVSSAQTSPITVLYDIVIVPILDMLSKCELKSAKSMILIPDSYTSLIPFVALHPEDNRNKTFGSTFSIQVMPSLMVMGILNGAHSTNTVVYDDSTTCVVGNPHIPIFKHNEEEWNLGRLPHATEEAKWISQLLKASPLLHEQATKSIVMSKLTSAHVIHIATHGSAVSSFLAFAGADSPNGKPSETDEILLLPSEVERLTIRAAMVVLSSCDSGRGTVRADGIIGMGRAFLLAGAQSVLTTLWRIPDESAGMFMQFFYQYLVDGLGTTHALQKATLSVRCFKKYSQYAHWGGFQLIGREMFFCRKKTSEETLLAASLGPVCVFPQVAIVEKLDQALVKNASLPSNVQILKGCEGTELSEPVYTFIHSFHHHFKGGIFWVSCRCEEMAQACVKKISEVIGTNDLMSHQDDTVLVVLDNIHPNTLSYFSSGNNTSKFYSLLNRTQTHIVATLSTGNSTGPNSLISQIDILLSRGSNIIEVEPLSPLHTTQRIVYEHMQKAVPSPPCDEDSTFLEKLADFTIGSPPVIAIMTSKGMSVKYPEPLSAFAQRLLLTTNEQSNESEHQPFSNDIYRIPAKSNCTTSCDFWGAIVKLTDLCELTPHGELFLYCLSIFHDTPVLECVLEGLAHLIQQSCCWSMSYKELCGKLMDFKIVNSYPHPVVIHPVMEVNNKVKEAPLCYIVTPAVATALWTCKMDDTDRVVAMSVVYRVLEDIYSNRHTLGASDLQHVLGLVGVARESFSYYCGLIGSDCYEMFYGLLLKYKAACMQ